MPVRRLLKRRLIRAATALACRFPKTYKYAPRQSPECIDLGLSERCNLHCPMCWIHGINGSGDKFAGREMNTDEVFDLVNQLSPGRTEIYIGGCEPLMRDDLLPILKHIKNQGLSAHFTTNGTLFDSTKSAMLVQIGVDTVNFSIDGNQELHDEIRGRGVYRKVVSAIKELRNHRDRAHKNKPFIGINITISQGILGRIGKIIRSLAEDTHDSPDFYRLHHLWYVTPVELTEHQFRVGQVFNCSAFGAASHLISESDRIDPVSIANEVSSLKNIPKLVQFPQMSRRKIVQYYSEGSRGQKQCFAPFRRAVVKPNGDVRLCQDDWIDGYTIGNVREDRIDKIWHSERARSFRIKLLRHKSFPACKRCSAMYTSD